MKIRRSDNAFILLEILVALVVFAAGIAVLMQALSQVAKTNRTVFDNQLAALTVDNLLNRYYAGELNQDSGITRIMGRDFAWEIKAGEPEDFIFELQAEVNWSEAGKRRQIVLNQQVFIPAD